MPAMRFSLIISLISAAFLVLFSVAPVGFGGNWGFSGTVGGIFTGGADDCLSPAGFRDCASDFHSAPPYFHAVSSDDGGVVSSLNFPLAAAADTPRFGLAADGVFLVGERR